MGKFTGTSTSSIGGSHFTGNGVNGNPTTGVGGFIAIASNYSSRDSLENCNVDIADWKLAQIYENKPLECSGLLGMTDARLTGYSCSFQCTVITNISSPPDLLFRGSCRLYGKTDNLGLSGCELTFYLGEIAGNAGNYEIEDRYYWSTDAVIDTATHIVDANGKRMNRTAITGRSRSHVFLIPDQGSPNDKTTIAGAYRYWYWNNRNK